MSFCRKFLLICLTALIGSGATMTFLTIQAQNKFEEKVKDMTNLADTLYIMYNSMKKERDSLLKIIEEHKYIYIRHDLAKEIGIEIPAYFPDSCIDSMLHWGKIFDIPNDIHFRLVWTESNFHHNSVSYMGARGLYQLMPATKALLISEGYIKSDFQRGCALLRKFKNNDKTWERALCHYNTGNPNIWVPNYVYKILKK